MAKRALIWTDTALKQRRQILKYWTERNGSTLYAEKLLKGIDIRLKLVVRNPEAFKLTNYPGVRATAIGHYSIIYKLTPDDVVVIAFWDNRQDPKKLLDLLTK